MDRDCLFISSRISFDKIEQNSILFKENEDRSIYGNKHKKLCEKDRDAFRIMGLKFSDDLTALQKKFKSLVKKFHPDKHSGDKQYEDKLKKITLAYSHLKIIMK